MGRLDSKVVVITGGVGGMGASHARRFVKEGAKVVITDLNETAGLELEKELGENAKFIKQDVTKQEDWDNVVALTESTFGPIHALVNNAGVGTMKPIESMTEDEYMKIININQLSVFLGMKAVLSSMRKAGMGSIVNISSIAGLIGSVGGVGYNASKFAMRGMTKVAALEFAEDNIRVNSVHPGLIETPLLAEEGNASYIEEQLKEIPLKRTAKPEEVTNLVLFLVSDESSYSTGSEFVIDGGLTAQ
ncbi:glucose 1-dehydrogenase [Fundicoccus culcitae]|uniref:Glucose 1-dehydrogenase n=1 Tax=Fundicoccus culcitae TaxID=2969821 RepID=A0ABY5P9M5_9LACT|nr:glucose 1-dehydrogenase [Fundicoccus culcitae]UUX35453.1 glucose 1-dehydrogenase [Fundicoccus culcitae]